MHQQPQANWPGLAQYETLNGTLPPAAITDKGGKPLLSWRVAILPYVERNDLYLRFHLDEPWDSPHNLGLLEAMPILYACPSDRTLARGMTGYLAVIGPETVFTPDLKPVKLDDIADGLDGTLLLSESRRGVPWTKPEDLPFDTNAPLNGLGGHHGDHHNAFNVLMVSGSARFLEAPIDPRLVRMMLTRNGYEVISAPSEEPSYFRRPGRHGSFPLEHSQ